MNIYINKFLKIIILFYKMNEKFPSLNPPLYSLEAKLTNSLNSELPLTPDEKFKTLTPPQK